MKMDRAAVRRWALAKGLAPDAKYKVARKPVRRWQVQQIGQLWQYDASPHRWFAGHAEPFPLLQIIDDHSRLLPLARLYPRETLLAHLDFLSSAFVSCGLPLALYVDYHSFFFTHQPDAFTQLGAALRFYEVSLRYAPTPQAKGKIERVHDFWQRRLPAIFVAEQIFALPAANALLNELRVHHNAQEKHREIGSTPKAAWNLALQEKRSVLRPTPRCPWWPATFGASAPPCASIPTVALPSAANACASINHQDQRLSVASIPMGITPFSWRLQSSIPCPFSSSIPRPRLLSYFDRTLLSHFEILTTNGLLCYAEREGIP